MKTPTALLLSIAFANFTPVLWAGASSYPNLIYGVAKEQDFVQADGTTVVSDNPGASFNPFIAGTPQDASTPATSVNVTTPGGGVGLVPLTFNVQDQQWEVETNVANLTILNASYPDGSYLFNVGGNTAGISVTGSTYSNTPMATVDQGAWLTGTLYVTPGVALTINSNIFSTNFVSGQSRVAIEVNGQSTGLDFKYDSLNDPTPLTADQGNVTIPGSALLSGNEYSVNLQFNVFTDFTNPGIDGGTNVGLYTMKTHFDIVAGSPIPEPGTYALLAGVVALGGTVWRRRRKTAKV